MDTESFKVLAYEKITDWLASCATSVRGRELCHALIPSGDFDTVVLLQNETKEAAHVMQIQMPPWGGIYDLRHALQKAARGSVLALEDLREVMSTLSAMRNVKYFFRDLQLDAVLLKERAVRIEILGMLERNLQNTIDEHGNFRDDASAELKRMTRELHAAQNRVKDRLSSVLHDPAYQKFFQDAIVTVRNERYVIPVKQEYRSDFPGVIHDRSASGATLFVAVGDCRAKQYCKTNGACTHAGDSADLAPSYSRDCKEQRHPIRKQYHSCRARSHLCACSTWTADECLPSSAEPCREGSLKKSTAPIDLTGKRCSY